MGSGESGETSIRDIVGAQGKTQLYFVERDTEALLSFLNEWSDLFTGALRQLADRWPRASPSSLSRALTLTLTSPGNC